LNIFQRVGRKTLVEVSDAVMAEIEKCKKNSSANLSGNLFLLCKDEA